MTLHEHKDRVGKYDKAHLKAISKQEPRQRHLTKTHHNLLDRRYNPLEALRTRTDRKQGIMKIPKTKFRKILIPPIVSRGSYTDRLVTMSIAAKPTDERTLEILSLNKEGTFTSISVQLDSTHRDFEVTIYPIYCTSADPELEHSFRFDPTNINTSADLDSLLTDGAWMKNPKEAEVLYHLIDREASHNLATSMNHSSLRYELSTKGVLLAI